MNRVRKWLCTSVNLSVTWAELLVIVALVVVINAIWPGVPTWVFLVIGVVEGITVSIVRDIRRWLRRRRTV